MSGARVYVRQLRLGSDLLPLHLVCNWKQWMGRFLDFGWRKWFEDLGEESSAIGSPDYLHLLDSDPRLLFTHQLLYED